MQLDPRTLISRTTTRLGPVTLATAGQGLCGLWFEGQKHHPDTTALRHDDRHPLLLQARDELAEYLQGRRTYFSIALDLSAGTAFQQAVWQSLLAIEPGTTTTYGALGRRVGRPAAVRAVGAAVGRNPLSVVVPCHRVLGADGGLTGYAGGLGRKAALLALETATTAAVHTTIPA